MYHLVGPSHAQASGSKHFSNFDTVFPADHIHYGSFVDENQDVNLVVIILLK